MLSSALSCILAFLLMASPGTEAQGQLLQVCPDGWVSWMQYCYMFVNTSSVTWSQANAECQDLQASLLRIETDDEYAFLRKAWASDPPVIPISEMYWTALNNLPLNQGAATKPDFIWGNDEFPLDSVVANNWDKEPDNTPDKDCAAVNAQGSLAMARCSDTKPYICEFQMARDEICRENWLIGYNKAYCYLISNVSDITQRVTWQEARKICEAKPNRKTTLIKVTSSAVQTFLLERLPGQYYGTLDFWTGLNDIDNEGTLIWAGNGGTPMMANLTDGMWRKEPDNLGGNEHCVAVMPYGRWNDLNCGKTLNYACRLALDTAAKEMNYGCGAWMRAGVRCVTVSNRKKTWDDARTFCQQGGGDLLSFSSQADADWLTIQAVSSNAQRRNTAYWIGLNDRQTENTFVWSDGSQLLASLLNWDKEPNNNQFCSAMNDAGQFFDFDCFHTHTGTICEDPGNTCIPPWIGYNNHCYLVSLTWKTRREAATFCNQTSASSQGRLLVLNTAAEKDWILSQLVLNNTTPHYFWTGLLNRNGWTWQYDDDQPNSTVTQQLVTWSQEPNNRGDEDCVEILANGRLNDAKCANTNGFICAKPAPGASTGTNSAVTETTRISSIFYSIMASVLLRQLV